MRALLSALSAAFLLVLSGCGGSSASENGPLVLAAASLQEAMEAAADDWAGQGHPRPVLSFAATSALARQVSSGAPGDLFVSADQKWMDDVAGKGLIEVESRADFLRNALVLVAPAGEPLELAIARDFPLAEAIGDGRLAMADPEAVPAGRYGKQALESLGVWSAVADKIANAENVRVALALVGRGEAPLGIVYSTDAVAEDGVQVVGTFPDDSHTPISYPLALLKTSTNPDAEAFRDYLLSEQGKTVFRRFGFVAD